ncbi:MAG: hypothetical protein OXH38_06140 [Chloroflexi bacterium]|nr:hypothetical protein [Chloroflexota bacterium]
MSGNETNPVRPKQISTKAGAVIAAAALVGVAGLVLLATAWEATPSPSSSVGTSGALRGWLAVAAALIASIATVVLAWFARRVPEGVSGLLSRLDDAEEARRRAEDERRRAEDERRTVEVERDTLASWLSRPYLHAEALVATEGNQYARVEVVGRPSGRVAPTLAISLPMGRLPQEFVLEKEECRKWFAEIEIAEGKTGEVAVLRYSNVALVATVNPPHDDETGGSLALFPSTTPAVPQVAFGVLHSWPEFRQAVREIATHRLPSRTEYMQLQSD